MKHKILFITSLLFLFVVTLDNAEELFIAVLDQPQGEENSDLEIRVLFVKENGKWISLNNQGKIKSYDFSKTKWTIAFDGRNIGQIQEIDLKQISPKANIPKISNKNEEFSGWDNVPEFRPLVLVSKPNYKDPERWKPFTPSTNILNSLFPKFKKVIGKVGRCQNEEENNLVPYDYKANDLLLFKSYRNTLEQMLISMGFNSKAYNCDGPIDPIWTPNWFLVDKQIHYIGNELTLVDAGDYDNDGKSEVIFWHSGYNEDGYSLFYNNFNLRTDFYWKYH